MAALERCCHAMLFLFVCPPLAPSLSEAAQLHILVLPGILQSSCHCPILCSFLVILDICLLLRLLPLIRSGPSLSTCLGALEPAHILPIVLRPVPQLCRMPREESTSPSHSQGSQAEPVQASIPSIPITTTKTHTRYEEPLPAAAKRVIRTQKAGGGSLSQHLHKFSQRGPRPFQPARQSTAKNKMAENTSAHAGKPPTLQEMYNSWRALEEQVDGIHRLPMFIRAERRACHRCRVLRKKVCPKCNTAGFLCIAAG